MTSMTPTGSSKRAIIRFLSINDVYELENLPRFATAVREVRHLSFRVGTRQGEKENGGKGSGRRGGGERDGGF